MPMTHIDDGAFYPGSYVKKLLARVGAGAGAEPVRWVELPEAAALLGRRPDTLRKQCARWDASRQPVVRVRKKSEAEGSHWLLCEQDLYGLVRKTKGGYTAAPEHGTEDDPGAPPPTDEDATVAHWTALATRDL